MFEASIEKNGIDLGRKLMNTFKPLWAIRVGDRVYPSTVRSSYDIDSRRYNTVLRHAQDTMPIINLP